MKILLNSSGWKAALTSLRSLGEKGHEVYVISDHPFDVLFFSKYCRGKVISPQETDTECYLNFLLDHLRSKSYDFFLPITDATCALCAENSEAIQRYVKMCIAPLDQFRIARDKVSTYHFALQNGIRIPETFFPQIMDDVHALKDSIVYPCMVKYGLGCAGSGNQKIETPEQLISFFAQATHPWPVIQVFMEAECLAFSGVSKDGRLLDFFIHQKVGQYPKTGGVTVYGKSVHSQAIYEVADSIVRKLRWSGPIGIDFFVKNGEVYLLEINPRLAAAAQFAYNCGVDLPNIYFAIGAMNKTDCISKGYQANKLYRCFFPYEILLCFKDKRYIAKCVINCFDLRYSYDFDLNDFGLFLALCKSTRWAVQKMLAIK